MTDRPPSNFFQLPPSLRALAGNRWVQILAFVFVAFEIYNTAVLPAIRGTFDAMKAQADARRAAGEAEAAAGSAYDPRARAAATVTPATPPSKSQRIEAYEPRPDNP